MGKTSSAVKNKWNDKTYDRINLTIPKGRKDSIKQHADSCGESVNAFIIRAINAQIERDNAKKLQDIPERTPTPGMNDSDQSEDDCNTTE